MRTKRSETFEPIEDDRADIPMFVVEGKKDLFTITCNRAGFNVLNEYLDVYASDATEKDRSNPFPQ